MNASGPAKMSKASKPARHSYIRFNNSFDVSQILMVFINGVHINATKFLLRADKYLSTLNTPRKHPCPPRGALRSDVFLVNSLIF